jgi:hypothetical protein
MEHAQNMARKRSFAVGQPVDLDKLERPTTKRRMYVRCGRDSCGYRFRLPTIQNAGVVVFARCPSCERSASYLTPVLDAAE